MNTNFSKLSGLIALSAAFALTSPAFADRINCSTATAVHDVTICSTPELSQLDERMAAESTQAMHRAPDIDTFNEQQAAWRSSLATCGADVDCLTSLYTSRFEQLSGSTSPSGTDEPTNLNTAPTAEAGLLPPTSQRPDEAATATAEAGDSSVEQRPAGLSASTLMYGAVMLIAAVAVVTGGILLVVGVRRLTATSAERYGWNVFLNWWNVLHLVGLVLGFLVGIINPAIGLIIFLACWLVMLAVNIKHTNPAMGLVITLIQPFFVLVLWTIFGMSANRRPTRT